MALGAVCRDGVSGSVAGFFWKRRRGAKFRGERGERKMDGLKGAGQAEAQRPRAVDECKTVTQKQYLGGTDRGPLRRSGLIDQVREKVERKQNDHIRGHGDAAHIETLLQDETVQKVLRVLDFLYAD